MWVVMLAAVVGIGYWIWRESQKAKVAEQKRIIDEFDQLVTMCDVLEAKLQQAQADADDLLAAIVHELLTFSGQGA